MLFSESWYHHCVPYYHPRKAIDWSIPHFQRTQWVVYIIVYHGTFENGVYHGIPPKSSATWSFHQEITDESLEFWHVSTPVSLSHGRRARSSHNADWVTVRFYDIQLNIKSEKGHDLQTIEVTTAGHGWWMLVGPVRSFTRKNGDMWYNPQTLVIYSDLNWFQLILDR